MEVHQVLWRARYRSSFTDVLVTEVKSTVWSFIVFRGLSRTLNNYTMIYLVTFSYSWSYISQELESGNY